MTGGWAGTTYFCPVKSRQNPPGRRQLDYLLLENRLARELLVNHPLDNLLVRQLSRPSPPLFNNI